MSVVSNNETQIFIAITLRSPSELHVNPINIELLLFYFTKSYFEIILLPPYWPPHLSFFPVFHIPESYVML
jgi:hypothetical protein